MTPVIQSVGLPPAQHADRVVAAMLRNIVSHRVERWDNIRTVLCRTPDGHPKAQEKLIKKLREAGGHFFLHSTLSTGKRGRYSLRVFCLDGWDATRKDVIFPRNKIPEKPWLACTIVEVTSKGHHVYDENASISMLVTHHALSRLAQRCGARTSEDLITVVHNIWMTFLKECVDREGYEWAVDDYRLKFPLTKTTNALAVLKHYDDGEGGIVVATIMDTDE